MKLLFCCRCQLKKKLSMICLQDGPVQIESETTMTSARVLLHNNRIRYYITHSGDTFRPTLRPSKKKKVENKEAKPGDEWRQERRRAQRKMYVHNRFSSRSLSHNAVGMFWIIELGELLSPHFKRHGNKGWILNVCNLWSRPLHSGSESHPKVSNFLEPKTIRRSGKLCWKRSFLNVFVLHVALSLSLSCVGQWEDKEGGTSWLGWNAAVQICSGKPQKKTKKERTLASVAVRLAWRCYSFVVVKWDKQYHKKLAKDSFVLVDLLSLHSVESFVSVAASHEDVALLLWLASVWRFNRGAW